MNPVRICLSLYGNTEEICRAILSAPEADLFEIRLDLSPEVDGGQIRMTTDKPLLFAAHAKPELLPRMQPFADYIDCEQAPAGSKNAIASIHTREGTPADLWRRLSGEHLTKIVLETQDYNRIYELLQLCRQYGGLCFASGETAAFSRILSAFSGAPWIYSCLPDRPTGDAQFSIRELMDVYRVQRFDQMPSVFGIVGNPVSHSRSPQFHNKRFADDNLPWIYLPFPCNDLASLFQCAPKFGVCGFSITHPYKQAVLPLVKSDSTSIESCNTVCYKDEQWHGTNTDVDGVRGLLAAHSVTTGDARIAIVGAGGAARAIAAVVRPHARALVFLNRTRARASRLAAEFQASVASSLSEIDYDILFQATPVGWKEGECPVDPELLKAGTVVIDSIYKETALLRKAESLGCRAINGEAWFTSQAEAQFQYWKGGNVQGM